MPRDLDRLAELARAAHREPAFDLEVWPKVAALVRRHYPSWGYSDYIAAVSPDVVLDLIEHVRAVESVHPDHPNHPEKQQQRDRIGVSLPEAADLIRKHGHPFERDL